jgi:hypothetical protein
MRVRTQAFLAAIALLAATAPGLAGGRTIVGEWGVTRAECGTTGAFRIASQAIVTDEMSCSLPGVTRSGEVVTFSGTCDDGGTGATPETVVATRRGEVLDLAFRKGGGRYTGLVYCGSLPGR